jgi:hypothetical protein
MRTATAGEMFVMDRLSLLKWFWLCLPIALSLGCSDSTPLEHTQARQKVTLSGTFLTENPDEIAFPTKVLFAIDCSLSMGMPGQIGPRDADPYGLRIQAARNFIETYNSNENVSFEVMLWNSRIMLRTNNGDGDPGFTKDPDELERVLGGFYNDSTTDYLGTLAEIHNDIQRDIDRTDDRDNLIRTKYIVVFLSDGFPFINQNEIQDPEDIWDQVEDTYAYAMDEGVGSMAFHTFLLLGGLDGNAAAQEYATTILEGMAEQGGGQFRLLENAEAIDFINVIDMRLTVEYGIKYLVAFNYNVRPGIELAHLDSDGDGLPDEEEVLNGSNPDVRDTDNDGMSDFLEVRASSPDRPLDPTVPDSPCDVPPDGIWPDSDSDGLNDCEEFVKGTQRLLPDTDRDGIPDGIEFDMGTNPIKDLETKDADYDGDEDWLEVQQHTNVRSNDPLYRARYAYHYDIQDLGLVEINQGTEMASHVREYGFTISNIDVMDTNGYSVDGTVYREPGNNIIRLYIAQVPEDTPDVRPLFRMAEVIINTETSDRNVVLTPGDFQLIE